MLEAELAYVEATLAELEAMVDQCDEALEAPVVSAFEGNPRASL